MTTETPSNNPYQAPKTEIHQDFNQGGPDLAGRGSRLLAAIVDSIISMIAIVPIWLLTDIFSNIMEGGKLSLGMKIGLGLYGFIIYLLVHGHLLNKYGQTVGKRLMGVFIADIETGEKLEIKNIILKRVLPVTLMNAIPIVGGFLGLIDALLIFRSDKRCGHDLIAGTHVLKVPSKS